jgi:thiazole synthase
MSLPHEISADDPLIIAGRTFTSRLFMGTSLYPNTQVLLDCLMASGTEMITAAVRRIHVAGRQADLLAQVKDRYHFLPNTAGCYTAEDAVLTAHLAREAFGTPWIKLEVIGDEDTLYPNNQELLRAAERLLADGFTVLPYCSDDPLICAQLEAMGCAAVMPLAGPIGSGAGLCNPYALRMIIERARVPVIIDAGIGTASDACIAMEMGASGVLLNTAIAKSLNPLFMATAMRDAIRAGRLAHLAGRIPVKTHASASTMDAGRVAL